MGGQTLYLLDTNILVHCVREDALWAEIREAYQLLLIDPTPMISVVSAGELRSLSEQLSWGKNKLDRMEFILGYFDEMPIDSRNLVEAYAEIDCHLIRRGLRMGKNDLWIAASAVVNNARLLTTDRDFDPLDSHYLSLELIAPKI